MTREEITHLVNTDPEYTIAALLRIYALQTADEKLIAGTRYQNGRGFSATDAEILTNISEFYILKKYLTERQIKYVRRAVQKYLGQIEGTILEPVPIETTAHRSATANKGNTGLSSPAPVSGKQVEIWGKHFVISFPYAPALVASVKTLTGRRWDGKKKVWTAPVCVDSFLHLKEWGFEFTPQDDEGKAILTRLQEESAGEVTEVRIDKIPGIKRPLLRYQHEGVEWIEAAKGRTIIGDQQGLGKTATGLAWLQYRPEIRPAVVVCPGNAKWGYHSETRYVMSTNDKTCVVSGEYRGNRLPKADIYIINYDILHITKPCKQCQGKGKKDGIKCRACKGKGKTVHVRPDLVNALKQQGGPKAVLIDELQYLQESDSFRTQAVTQLCTNKKYWPPVEHILPSSGTPIKHRPKNFFPTLNLVRPDLFPSFWKFGQRYCGANHNGFGWDFSGASHTQELHDILIAHKVLLRRTKDEVLPQLPKMRRAPVSLELAPKDMREYKRAEDDFLTWLSSKGDPDKLNKAERAEALARLTALKNLVSEYKIKLATEWIENFLEGGQSLIVFAHHQSMVKALYSKFHRIAVKVDGGTADTQKRDAETAFQACGRCGVKKDKHDIEPGACEKYVPGPIKLFIGTLAAKEALTLTAAEDTVFVELWDSPKDHEQAEERCYGRVSDPHGATAWYLLARDTIDEHILKAHDHKRAAIDAIIDGKEAVQEESLTYMLNNMLK